MVEEIRKINLKTAVCMGICFYSLIILIHVLIIGGIIPLTWINGGRSESMAAQLPISIINIIISIIGGIFTLTASRTIPYTSRRKITFMYWLFVILWFFGLVQQLLGTPFEKIVCSLLLILGIISNLRMAVEKREQ